MARVTVEDCVTVVPNRFELCLVTNDRARSILSGSPTELGEKEKPPVTALREIAEGLVKVDAIRENIVNSIKNKSHDDYNDLLANTKSTEMVEEEVNVGANSPKGEGNFSGDNVEVDD